MQRGAEYNLSEEEKERTDNTAKHHLKVNPAMDTSVWNLAKLFFFFFGGGGEGKHHYSGSSKLANYLKSHT